MRTNRPRIVLYFVAAGFLIPCFLFLLLSVGKINFEGAWEWIVLVPWPTFPLIMSAEADGTTFGLLIAFLTSALANVVIYALVGSIFSFGYRQIIARSK